MKIKPLVRQIGLVYLVATLHIHAQELPARKDILATMTLANGYFMQLWPDPGKEIVTNKTRPSNIWTRAVYYEGLMALYGIDKKRPYYDYALDWGNKHHWGLRSGMNTRNADDQCCGQTYIDLYLLDRVQNSGSVERVSAIKASIDNMLANDKVDDWS